MTNMFDRNGANEVIARINKLTPETKPNWGKMTVSQMLAHCSVAYEMFYEKERFDKPVFFTKLMLKLFVKSAVVGDKPYPKNSRTAPEFIIADERNFENEKQKLIAFINQTQELGATYFDGKESLSLGVLTTKEWNTTFSKHIDHHLTQFGV